MARSQATFSKKEKETKKLKKRKEKEEKKEERKANAVKGKSMEDMLAYVDEDGNITSTPPDPKKKKIIKQEDIQIGIPTRVEEATDIVRKGVVTFFNESKGYGFIKDMQTQESIFVHVKGLQEPVKENNIVTFEIEMTPKGANAVNVKKGS
jgi:cold shock CspA family protein